MGQGKPLFTIEKHKMGLGQCVIAQWPYGRREVVTGFGTERQAQNWIDQDAVHWLEGLDHKDGPGK
jgi:hypothetical protein